MSEREQPLTDELTRRHAVGLAASLALGAALRPNFSLAREPEPGDDHGGGGHGADDPPGDDHGGIVGDTDDSDDDAGGSGANGSGRRRRRRRGRG
jgi:hypothetical protein